MKIAVMGAGAVGSYFGGMLAKAGEDVTLIARGNHLQALKEKGLTIRTKDEEFKVKPKATDNPAEVGEADFILLTVKSYDTEQAILQCKPLIGDNTIVMSIQNGVDNREKIEANIDKEKVLPALARLGASIESPGIVKLETTAKIIFGEENGKKTDRTDLISKVFEKAKIEHIISDKINYEIWKKYMWNISFNQLCAITRKTCGEIVNCNETKQVAVILLNEVIEIANKKGINLSKADIDTTLTLSPQFQSFKPSMLQDIEKGKRIEYEAFSGTAVRYGKELGLQTPANSIIYALLKLI